MSKIIEARQLVRHFGSVKAVNGVSFGIEQGCCFGLLGPNGAGKTTTVEMLEGIVAPDSGQVLYQGEPLSGEFRQRAGIMFQSTALQDYITVSEALDLFASFYNQTLPKEHLIEVCALAEFLNRDTRKLSGGQKQRLLLAIALINDPNVVFLDEPTTGLDPQARRNFWRLLQDIKRGGKTIVLTTHYMEEASTLCDELVFMDHGVVIAQGSPTELLKSKEETTRLIIPLADWPWTAESGTAESRSAESRSAESVATENRAAENSADTGALAVWPESNAVNSSFTVHTQPGQVVCLSRDVNQTLSELLNAGVPLANMQLQSRTLEDLFIELTGEGLRA